MGCRFSRILVGLCWFRADGMPTFLAAASVSVFGLRFLLDRAGACSVLLV